VKETVKQLLANSDIVSREEFEVVRDMAAKARAENDMLMARIENLEAKLTSSKKKGSS
jgi:BMFP domain-containing protein YqiC